jgi:hypothetical protein
MIDSGDWQRRAATHRVGSFAKSRVLLWHPLDGLRVHVDAFIYASFLFQPHLPVFAPDTLLHYETSKNNRRQHPLIRHFALGTGLSHHIRALKCSGHCYGISIARSETTQRVHDSMWGTDMMRAQSSETLSRIA